MAQQISPTPPLNLTTRNQSRNPDVHEGVFAAARQFKLADPGIRQAPVTLEPAPNNPLIRETQPPRGEAAATDAQGSGPNEAVAKAAAEFVNQTMNNPVVAAVLKALEVLDESKNAYLDMISKGNPGEQEMALFSSGMKTIESVSALLKKGLDSEMKITENMSR
jgi:hypothetical protein